MKGGTVFVELHGWRGIGSDRDLFLRFVRLGFLTVGASPLLTDRLIDLHRALLRLRDADVRRGGR